MPARKLLAYSQLLLGLVIVFLSSAVLSSRIIQKGEIVSVPDVTGKTVAEAGRELARKKLSLQEKSVEFSDRFERGQIISQDPPAGSKIRVNRLIRVILSGGSEMVEVPALVGRSMEAASKVLGEIGLQRGLVSQIHTPKYAAGRIIAQEPAPGEQKVKRATPVHFLVSQGDVEPKYLMPDLIERESAPTIVKLEKLGFKISNIRHQYYPGRSSGFILNHSPPPGYAVSKRSLISLEVSR